MTSTNTSADTTARTFRKSWTDQPDEVTTGKVVAHGFASGSGLRWEIRVTPAGKFFVSSGTLFGSQTVRCADALVAFAVLNVIENHDAEQEASAKLPEGATLIEE